MTHLPICPICVTSAIAQGSTLQVRNVGIFRLQVWTGRGKLGPAVLRLASRCTAAVQQGSVTAQALSAPSAPQCPPDAPSAPARWRAID